MKIELNNFLGEKPGISDTSIEMGNSTIALDVRLRSGDASFFYADALTPPNTQNPSVTTFTKEGTIQGLYPMDRDGLNGGPYWLNWTKAEATTQFPKINVVRGPIPGDTIERVYYTGAIDADVITDSSGDPVTPLPELNYQPKTTNRPIAIPTDYTENAFPVAWNYLGIPNPVGMPTVTQSFAYTVDSTENFSEATTTTLPSEIISTPITNNSNVSVDLGLGNPLYSMRMFQDNYNGLAAPCYALLPAGLGTIGKATQMQFDFYIYGILTPATPTGFCVYIGSNLDGVGTLVNFFIDAATGYIQITSAPSYDFTGNGSMATYSGAPPNSFPFTMATWYTAQISVNPQVGGDPGSQLTDSTISVQVFPQNGGSPLSTENAPPAASLLNTNYTAVVGNSTAFLGTYSGFVIGSQGNINNDLEIRITNIFYTSLDANYVPEETSWVYTLLNTPVGTNTYGEESGPSNPSGIYFEDNNSTIFNTVSISETVPQGYDIYGINLYRSLTSTQATEYQFDVSFTPTTSPPVVQSSTTPGTYGTNTYTVTDYRDSVNDVDLGDTLATTIYAPPPVDGRNIISLANGITLMSSQNTICPSVAYQPYSYPIDYQLATDFPIVAMASINTTAVVLTEESPYIVTGSDPSALSMSKIASVRGCISQPSVVNWESYGVVYASQDGLVIIGNQGGQLVTEAYITQREWLQFNPSTMVGVIHEDAYYGSYTLASGTKGTIIFDLRRSNVFSFNTEDIIGFSRLSRTFSAAYNESLSDGFYFTPVPVNETTSTTLPQFEGQQVLDPSTQTTPGNYQWRSKVFQWPYQCAPMAGQVKINLYLNPVTTGKNLTLNLYKNRETSPYFSQNILETSPRGGDLEFVITPIVAFELQLEVIGNVPVNMISVAEEMDDLCEQGQQGG